MSTPKEIGEKQVRTLGEAEASLAFIAISNIKYIPTYQINIVNSNGAGESERFITEIGS